MPQSMSATTLTLSTKGAKSIDNSYSPRLMLRDTIPVWCSIIPARFIFIFVAQHSNTSLHF